MMMLGVVAGACAGASLLLLTHLAPFFAISRVVPDIDQPTTFFFKKLSRREAHILGAAIHIVTATLFGALYAYFVREQLAPGFTLLPLLGWGGVLALFMGGIVMPLEGHGIFGIKEDRWFPMDLFLTNFLWAFLFWVFVHVWIGIA